MVFFWKQPGKEACNALLEWMLQTTHDVGKAINITQQTVADALWYWYALPFFAGHHWALLMLVFTDTLYDIGLLCHSLLVIVCHDFIEKCTKELLVTACHFL